MWTKIAFVFLTFSSLYFTIATAAIPLDWQGTYNDPIYGGNISVCVSLANSVYYGQALFSKVGYMRGTINPATFLWTGVFFIAGIETKQGTFSLQLSSGATTMMAGSFTENPTVTYSMSSSRLSAQVPSDLECFRADNSMLTTTVSTDLTGSWNNAISMDPTPYYLSVGNGLVTGSYAYEYDDGTSSPGTSSGTSNLNGQVLCDNWYESGTDTGIELLVAKNATEIYLTWWFVPHMSAFDYSLSLQPGNTGSYPARKHVSVLYNTATTKAYEYTCYILSTSGQEQSCMAGFASSPSTMPSASPKTNSVDDDDAVSANYNILVAIFVFTLLTFVIMVSWFVFVACFQHKQPLALQQHQQQQAAGAHQL